ncbi:MAG: phosphoenolpyruvate--protein phosphotransferase, partial [Treponemataceae bacterium]|nr:phosphoenolpyruvate--protein phosphotransferase [Treponemataceae bacterium]
NYGIPAVVGLNAGAMKGKIQNSETVIVDTELAELVVAPEPQTLLEYREKVRKEAEKRENLKKYLGRPATTSDGVPFTLSANIGSPEEAETALFEGADGIGLFRTEFLFMSRTNAAPHEAGTPFDEDAQFDAYRRVLEIMQGRPVTIRTLDVGGDKLVRSADIPAFEEKNPLMGMRAVRLCLAYPQLLRTQLRALYRASVHGTLRIMLPLITSAEQIRQCLALAAAVREELAAERIPFKADVPIGIMIETAAAALCADEFAELCDFFSLGTNDLTQYTLCIDRENVNVSEMYDEFHPAVLKLIAMTIQSAQAHGIPVSVCGEMAGRDESVLVLGGMGIRSLSMSPKSITKIKRRISKVSLAEMQKLAAEKSART